MNKEPYAWFSFGIDSSKKMHTNTDFMEYWNNCQFYALAVNFQRQTVYLRRPFVVGFDDSIIKEHVISMDFNQTTWYNFKMILNMRNKILKFEFNDKKIPIYHPNVDFKNNKEYYMATQYTEIIYISN